jgi:hypothetical protein
VLAESRKYQSDISTRHAEQALGALLELLRGFQAADEATRGALLGALSRDDPQHIYGGLLTVLLRLVFLLHAEDRGLMPCASTGATRHSVTGLYLRLREDAGRDPDTMAQRFGAWSALLALFRLVHTGATDDRLHLPAREGSLFDPDGYPFLEGRVRGQPDARRPPPRVPDGVLWRILQSLLLLDGERLSYRSLDVEQIGGVYESMIGFKLERTNGPSIAVRPQHVVVDLADLLSQKPDARAKFLKAQAGCDLTGASLAALKSADTPEDLVAALGRKQSPHTPAIVPAGSLVLQPGEERRKSGSHYTPRSLTGPIVRATLRPVLAALGDAPTPQQILDLKLCDPAMGSGAFLVEAARQLGEQLRRAWELHRAAPPIPPDDDLDLHARRLVAQRCLHGVDRDPFAVDLARLSLWLVTAAKDHPFTFVDHALKHGDSLVGLSNSQIADFRWDHETRDDGVLFAQIRQQVGEASALRREAHNYGDHQDAAKRSTLKLAEAAVHQARLIGDAAILAYFSRDSDKHRNTRREEVYRDTIIPAQKGDPRALDRLTQLAAELRGGDRPVTPFHWELEFPEVFDREDPGFDCFVGNPPFLGGKRISTVLGNVTRDWLAQAHVNASSNADLAAHFFRRAYHLLRATGTFGLIATNTITQGDTLRAGLSYICHDGGVIYEADRRIRWPGAAAVMVCVVHVARARAGVSPPHRLDQRPVDRISAFLFHAGGDEMPVPLRSNTGISFIGCDIKGAGFTFDDTVPDATPVARMRELLALDASNAEVVRPYIGGEEINSDPRQAPHRYVIHFGEMPLEAASRWPALLQIVEEKVRPRRLAMARDLARWPWWQFWRVRARLAEKTRHLSSVLVNCQVTAHLSFAFLPTHNVFAHTVNVFAVDRHGFFAILQSRSHEIWARFFGSSMKDDLRYTPSDCFETFPLPPDWQHDAALAQAGKRYYELRADLMVRNNEGLTAIYNRFHNPDERSPDILRLRDLHAEMDRTVLTAYGWPDLAARATCEFRLDYEDDNDDPPRARTRKKPWRHRWPQAFHDEVLARLLDLNHQRASQERPARPPAALLPPDDD